MREDRRLLAVTAYPSSEAVLYGQVLDSYVSGWDDDSLPLTFAPTSCPADGSLVLHLLYSLGSGTLDWHGDGSFAYQADEGFIGLEIFEFSVTDGVAIERILVVAPEFAEAEFREAAAARSHSGLSVARKAAKNGPPRWPTATGMP